MKTTQRKRIRASKCLDFLHDHPISPDIISSSGLPDCLYISLQPCCKNGYSSSAKHGISIYRDDPLAEKFKAEFDKEYEGEKQNDFDSIDIPYKDKFGEPWRFDHVEYWYEISFKVFEGNVKSKTDYFDFKKWANYGGLESGAYSFEDAIIEGTKWVKKTFGNFGYNSFLTPEEIENHKHHNMFNSKKCEDREGFYEMIDNDKYIDVHNGHKNLRWLKWFMTTDYAKEHWSCEFKKWNKQIHKQGQ
jgi:hypothetical protein